MTTRTGITGAVLAMTLSLVAGAARAQSPRPLTAAPTEGGVEETGATASGRLARKLVNPLADMVSVPFQFNWMRGVGPDDEVRRVINIQPVVPVSLGSRWNLIERVVMPFIAQPDGLGSSSGSGDVMASTFFSPKRGAGGVTWGVGPILGVPTTTDPTLGSGKWSAGPSAIVMKQEGRWAIGLLANQLWSFASSTDASRPEVSQMLVQPVVAYVTPSGVTLTAMSETTANWNAASGADTWTIPVMGTVSKIVRVGVLPVSLQAGGGVYLARPAGGPRWQIRSGLVVILPKVR